MLKRDTVVLTESKRHRFGKLLAHLFLLKVLDFLLQHLDVGALALRLLAIFLPAPEEVEAGLANDLSLLHLYAVHIEKPFGLLILLRERLVNGQVHWMVAVVALLLQGKRLGPSAILLQVLAVEHAAAVAVTSCHMASKFYE